jgi:hypothetical protein
MSSSNRPNVDGSPRAQTTTTTANASSGSPIGQASYSLNGYEETPSRISPLKPAVIKLSRPSVDTDMNHNLESNNVNHQVRNRFRF